jgi:RNA polymerase primary sigma factor
MDSVKPNFSGAHEELLEDAVSIEDIDEVLEKLATAGISGNETDEPVIGDASSSAAQAEDDDSAPEEMELDLSAGELDKTSDPVRVYMREMGVVPLLKREQEVSIAKRIEWGQKRAQKGITRSPMAVAELLKVGAELEAGTLGIRDVVVFSDQMETEEHEDKTEEYLAWTIEGIGNIRKLYKRGLKELGQLNAEQKLRRGKASKKLTRLRRKVARTRLEIVHEIGLLHLKEAVRQRLINAIATMHRETRKLVRVIEANTSKLSK